MELIQKMREELAQRIEDTFANVHYPGDDNIGGLSVDDFIGQKEWKKVPLEMLLHKETEIPIFTSEAFHFYLPAFLSAVLRYSEADIMLDSVVDNLIPSPTPYMKFIVEHAIKLFNSAEKALILEFLERLSELFPQSNYVILDKDRLELQRAIQFWQMNR